MATINLDNLDLAGADLFSDSENYLNELTVTESTNTHGGFLTSVYCITAITYSIVEGARRLTKLAE